MRINKEMRRQKREKLGKRKENINAEMENEGKGNYLKEKS